MPSEFLAISPYIDGPADLQPKLVKSASAEVVVVGGGYTGLSTAMALRQAGKDVVLLERDFCGFGASGRNAGHLTPTIGKDLPTLVMMYGEKRAAELVRFAERNVERVESLMAAYGIACDYKASGNVMAVTHPRQERRLRKAAAVAGQLGAKTAFLEPDDMRRRCLPDTFLCGALESVGGTLHPGKLVLGLRRAALKAGVRIHEQTPVTRFDYRSKPTVTTEQGLVRTEKIVLATNAYTRELGWPGGRIVPLYITLFETGPLSDAQLEAIGGWPGREGIYTAHELLESYRLTAARTIIGGSKRPRYGKGGALKLLEGSRYAASEGVATAFRARFPALSDLPMAHFWAGWVGMTANFLPSIGPLDGNKRLFHAIGFNGHGVAMSIAAGEILADMILARANPWRKLAQRTAPTLPPDPILGGGVSLLLSLFASIDRRGN